ncbi:hypothetical protein FOL47_010078 [Perkinsus chesapeaki]|uniref:Uncharacterized protein n=1 Tax=Perkinsus chesapeaki TaxID=330153 RepID=A0A7J6MQE5_PERCH|nr:hypothetical protein FOL47_010078 [Perkinsus chesapeaki]
MVRSESSASDTPYFVPLKRKPMNSKHMDTCKEASEGRVTVVGDSGVGKTTLITLLRSIVGNPSTTYAEEILHRDHIGAYYLKQSQPTIGVDFVPMTINHQGKDTKVGLWDCGGHQRVSSIVGQVVGLGYDSRTGLQGKQRQITFKQAGDWARSNRACREYFELPRLDPTEDTTSVIHKLGDVICMALKKCPS